MTSTPSFWKRVENFVRGRNGIDDFSVLTPVHFETARPANKNGNGNGHVDRDLRGGSLSDWLPWPRKRASVNELREGYARMLELLDAVRGHFDSQDRRSAELNGSIQQIAGTLEQLAQHQRSQGSHIATMAGQIDAVGRASGPLIAGLIELPASLQSQADAVRSVAKRLETAHAEQAQVVDALSRFGDAGETLRQSGEAQVNALSRLHAGSQQLQDALTSAIKQQNRRITLLVAIVGGIGLVMLAGMLVLAAVVLRQ
ncbi:MAG: hypothetical protein ACKVS9_16200 [Phycisphaerae bacterium]